MRALILTFFILTFASCKNHHNEQESWKTIEVDELTVNYIHQAFRRGEYTSEDLVKAYLDRIEKHDHIINSITEINPKALEIAKFLDKEYLQTGKLRPLHGIPMIVKDNYETKGMVTAAGSKSLADFVPSVDASQVKKLKEAGAILLAKSNMAEWAFSPMHTESSTHGTTRNPYNPSYVPAGSSGGTAAAIAANFGTIGLGTDTGNSIRGPSSHNALVGFRSTLGLTSRTGIVPLYLRNDVGGPMCRTVEDAARVLEVIAGFDPEDPLTSYSKDVLPGTYLSALQSKDLTDIRIGVSRQLMVPEEMDTSIAILFEQALKDMKNLGAEIIDPYLIPGFEEIRKDQWCNTFKNDLEEYLKERVKNSGLNTLEEIIEMGSDSDFASHRLERNLANPTETHEDGTPCKDAYQDSRRIAYRKAIEDQMDLLKLDAIIYPSWNYPPAMIEAFEEEYRGDNSQIIAPHTGQPAFTVPMGYSSLGLPAGLQVLGKMFDEPKLINIAYAYEQATQHRRPPRLQNSINK